MAKKEVAEYIISLIVNFVYMLYFYIYCYYTYVLINFFSTVNKTVSFIISFVYVIDIYQRELIFDLYLISLKIMYRKE